MPNPRRGVLLAILAYSAWGFLSPVGKILIVSVDPFTLNAVRTLLALPLLALIMGRKSVTAGLVLLRHEPKVWILGGVWLTLTFVPYLWSLKYLPPTITTLTVYLSPLLVAAWQRLVLHERVGRLLVPAAVATLVGGAMALYGDAEVRFDRQTLTALIVAVVGIVGWTGYTIQAKALTARHEPDAVTFAAFVTSGVAFSAGALLERPHVAAITDAAPWLLLYILLPSVASFWLYSRALRLADAATVSVFLGVELVATIIVSYVLGHVTGAAETFGPLKLAGMALTIVALTAYLLDERRLQDRTETH